METCEELFTQQTQLDSWEQLNCHRVLYFQPSLHTTLPLWYVTATGASLQTLQHTSVTGTLLLMENKHQEEDKRDITHETKQEPAETMEDDDKPIFKKPHNVKKQKLVDKQQAKPSVSKSKPNELMDAEVRWWFSECAKTTLECRYVDVGQQKLKFNQRKIQGFSNFYFVVRLPGGTAIGKQKVCDAIIQRKHHVPPLVCKRKQSFLEKLQYQKSIFAKTWIVVHYKQNTQKEDDDQDVRQLVCLPDLIKSNASKLTNFVDAMKMLFESLCQSDKRLCNFLCESLERCGIVESSSSS